MEERGSVILKGEVHSFVQSVLLSISYPTPHVLQVLVVFLQGIAVGR